MELHIRVDHYLHGPTDDAAFTDILAKLELILERMNTMSAALDAVTVAVSEQHTVIDSAITLLTQLSDQIDELSDDPAALHALATEIRAKKDALAQAVVANTPVVPAPPAPTPEPPVEPPPAPSERRR